jgi:uncharacterized protein (DUF2141 family)
MGTMKGVRDACRPIAARDRKVIDKVRVLRLACLNVAMLLAMPVASGAAITGPDVAACAAGARGSALLVHVSGFKDRAGLLRISTYPATEADWLVKGRYTKRIDMPVPAAGDVDVCVGLTGAGHYGVAVLHDRNGDHHPNIFRDGGGFSNNPSLGFSKPGVEKVSFVAGAGVTQVAIKLKYL